MAKTYKFGNGTWATKKNSTLAYSDTNNAFKPLPFSFERNSIATRVNKEGLIEVVSNDVPRIDYTDSADGALLLEPQRTNLIPYSEDFSDASWTKFNSTAIANSIISPDGSLSATKLTEDTSSATHRIYDTIVVSFAGVVCTQSIFAKSDGSGRYLRMFRGSGTYNYAVFDLDNGVVFSQGGSNLISTKIEKYPNGWYKCSSTFTTQFGNIATYYGMQNGNLDSYTGDGTSGIYIWGAQLEEGSYATSYIPTNGSIVQRQADTASGSGNSEVFNDSEGVLFADIAALADDSTNRYISISDGTSVNRIHIFFTPSNTIRGLIRPGNGNIDSDVNILLFNKAAYKYKSGDSAFWVNGFKVGVNTDTTMPSGLDQLNFNKGDGTLDFYGKTKEIGYYDEILTDLELEYLTSYRSLNELVTELNLNTL